MLLDGWRYRALKHRKARALWSVGSVRAWRVLCRKAAPHIGIAADSTQSGAASSCHVLPSEKHYITQWEALFLTPSHFLVQESGCGRTRHMLHEFGVCRHTNGQWEGVWWLSKGHSIITCQQWASVLIYFHSPHPVSRSAFVQSTSSALSRAGSNHCGSFASQSKARRTLTTWICGSICASFCTT